MSSIINNIKLLSRFWQRKLTHFICKYMHSQFNTFHLYLYHIIYNYFVMAREWLSKRIVDFSQRHVLWVNVPEENAANKLCKWYQIWLFSFWNVYLFTSVLRASQLRNTSGTHSIQLSMHETVQIIVVCVTSVWIYECYLNADRTVIYPYMRNNVSRKGWNKRLYTLYEIMVFIHCPFFNI